MQIVFHKNVWLNIRKMKIAKQRNWDENMWGKYEEKVLH